MIKLRTLFSAAVACTLLTAGAAQAIPGPAPALYYNFENNVSNLGAVSNGLAGNILGAGANYQAGTPGGSASTVFRFTDTGTHEIATGIGAIDMGIQNGTNNAPYTMAAWVRPESNSGDNMIFGQNGGSRLHNGTRNNSYHQGHWGADMGKGTVNAISLGDWRHVAYRYSGTQSEIFINGVSIGSQIVGGMHNGNTEVYIGGVGGQNRDFDGDLDDVLIYNLALTNEQIVQLAAGEIVGVDTGGGGGVPEPATALMLGLGLMGSLGLRRRRTA